METTIPGQLDEITLRLNNGDLRMQRIEMGLSENTLATQRIEANTSDLVKAFNALTNALKVAEFIGRAAKPFIWISGAVAATVTAWINFKHWLGF